MKPIDWKAEAEERDELLQQAMAKQKEYEQWEKALEMCISAGFLKREKFNEALAFVKKFHAS